MADVIEGDGAGMNGEAGHRGLHGVWAIAALACACGLGACVDVGKYNYFATTPVDPTSPVAAQVRAALAAPGPYPKFSEIPPAPMDVRPVSAWRQAAEGVIDQRKTADAEAAAYPFSLRDSEAWAAEQRAKIPADEQTAPSADASKSSEAYAKKERARATPPSAPQ